ncbi:hypothetical protein JCM10296v2_003210 [Rhodotorula toruloides]
MARFQDLPRDLLLNILFLASPKLPTEEGRALKWHAVLKSFRGASRNLHGIYRALFPYCVDSTSGTVNTLSRKIVRGETLTSVACLRMFGVNTAVSFGTILGNLPFLVVLRLGVDKYKPSVPGFDLYALDKLVHLKFLGLSGFFLYLSLPLRQLGILEVELLECCVASGCAVNEFFSQIPSVTALCLSPLNIGIESVLPDPSALQSLEYVQVQPREEDFEDALGRAVVRFFDKCPNDCSTVLVHPVWAGAPSPLAGALVMSLLVEYELDEDEREMYSFTPSDISRIAEWVESNPPNLQSVALPMMWHPAYPEEDPYLQVVKYAAHAIINACEENDLEVVYYVDWDRETGFCQELKMGEWTVMTGDEPRGEDGALFTWGGSWPETDEELEAMLRGELSGGYETERAGDDERESTESEGEREDESGDEGGSEDDEADEAELAQTEG